MPLSWNGSLLTFADLRFVADDADGREGNFGLGARLLPEEWPVILGAYGFYDNKRSQSGTLFDQITAGAEILGRNFDFRLNGYFSLDDAKGTAATSVETDFAFSGHGILATQTVQESIFLETPMSGFDVEVGHRIPFLEDTWFEDTRAYGAYFKFDSPDADGFDGYRFRARTSLTDWLQIGIEHQNDDVRGNNEFAEIRFRIPFGGGHESKAPEGLYRRMNERVERDIDIVTVSSGAQMSAVTESVVTNKATDGSQEIFIVDNTAAGGGDGSAETPFNTLAAAQAAAGPHDIIYVRSGNGTSSGMNTGITIDDAGQRLIGSGTDFVLDTAWMEATGLRISSTPLVIAPATDAPLITNSAVNGDGVTITGNGAQVAGVTVSAAQRDGIVINADQVSVSDVTVTDSVRYGIYATANGAASNIEELDIRDSTLTRNASYGLYLYAQAGGDFTNTSLSGLTISDNIGYGGYLFATGAGSTLSGLALSDSMIEGNSDSGFVINAAAGGSISSPTLSGITAQDNSFHGLWIQSTGAGSAINNLSAENIVVRNQSGASTGTPLPAGLYLFADTGGGYHLAAI